MASTARLKEPQLEFDFTSPLDHYDQLFQHQQDFVVLWHKDRRDLSTEDRPGPVWKSLKPTQTHGALLEIAGQFDKYITPNEFAGWRKLNLLRGLNAVYLDFDSHDKKRSQKQLAKWRSEVLAKIKSLGWPEPTFSVMTGRGFHLYWTHHRTDRRALNRWQALIRHMRKTLGADPMSVDCCRVLRIIGTRNSSADHSFIVHGYQHSGQTYNFEWLYERICKPQKADIREIEIERKARAERKAARTTKSDAPKDPSRFANILGWWLRLNEDLWKLAAHHAAADQYEGKFGMREGKRMAIIELYCAAVCWFRPADALEEEVLSFAKRFAPSLKDHEVLKDTATLRKAAAKAAAGETATFEGQIVDPRYKYSRERLWDKIGKLVPESLYPELQVLLPDHLAAAKDKERRKAADAGRDRVAEGRYASKNTGQGVRQINALKRVLARQKAASGVPIAQIARELTVDRKTIDRWLAV